MKKYLVLYAIIIGFCLVFLEGTSYGFALNISPPSFKTSIKPGTSASGAVTVQNNSKEATGILV